MKRAKVLIADDDSKVRKALRLRLQEWGFSVIEAADGLGVLTQAAREKFDAIILDHEMPLGDGRTIAGVIRRGCDAPIVFLSGHDRESFRETVFRLPDVYFLPKPFEAGRLSELLAACVGPQTTLVGGSRGTS